MGFFLFAALFFLFGLFLLYFFRDPERKINQDEKHILAPADGKVMEVMEENGRKTIRIFMSPLDVHIQRAPVRGIVESVEYKKGKFLQAFRKQASVENEQNIIRLGGDAGGLEIKQIAGVLARRIECWVKPGQRLGQGERLGMIKLGSQVDLTLSAGLSKIVVLKVKQGEKVQAGKTVIGDISEGKT